MTDGSLKTAHWPWIALAIVVCFFTVGIPYWQIPYSSVSLPSALYAPGLLVVVVAALMLRATAEIPFWKSVRFMTLPMPLAVFVRVSVETAQDPTSHNLWPFEIVIAAGLGFLCALVGSTIGHVLAWARPR